MCAIGWGHASGSGGFRRVGGCGHPSGHHGLGGSAGGWRGRHGLCRWCGRCGCRGVCCGAVTRLGCGFCGHLGPGQRRKVRHRAGRVVDGFPQRGHGHSWLRGRRVVGPWHRRRCRSAGRTGCVGVVGLAQRSQGGANAGQVDLAPGNGHVGGGLIARRMGLADTPGQQPTTDQQPWCKPACGKAVCVRHGDVCAEVGHESGGYLKLIGPFPFQLRPGLHPLECLCLHPFSP